MFWLKDLAFEGPSELTMHVLASGERKKEFIYLFCVIRCYLFGLTGYGRGMKIIRM